MPGVRYVVRPVEGEVEPLRTDVAGVLLRCERGPIASLEARVPPVRVRDLRELAVWFGGPLPGTDGFTALQGYFDNGGQVLWVARVAPGATVASASLDVTALNGALGSTDEAGIVTRAARLRFVASSPGAWGNGLSVRVRVLPTAAALGLPRAELWVSQAGRDVEQLRELDPARFVELVNETSLRVRVAIEASAGAAGPLSQRDLWLPSAAIGQAFEGGAELTPSPADYQVGALALVEQPEPALLFAPDARAELGAAATSFYGWWANEAATPNDRLVLVDPPPESNATSLRALADEFRAWPRLDDRARRGVGGRFPASAALYYPSLKVNQTGVVRTVAPSGHVAGLIARLDRERGAHQTPANAPLVGVVDLDRDYDEAERAGLHVQGLNALRCTHGRGVEVWGSRTLDLRADRRALAHRRLLHRLIRVARRVASTLIFDSNTTLLRLTLARTLTAVLLQAFRAGALKGRSPVEAFRVQCDDSTNPPDAFEQGVCIAEVAFAPAAPMEFIELKVALTRDGSLEVLE